VLILNQYLENSILHTLGVILIVAATALTIVSLIDYIWKNKDVLKEQK
jgi:CDP-diacylglycerol--glycerol-3-phosphate 3-phosphatidyltransferase